MRLTSLLLPLVSLSMSAVAAEEAAPAEPEAQQETPPFKAEHPGDTALSQDEDGNWRFRSFPGLATLYVYAKDTPGKSNCGDPCISAWAPFLASSTETKAIGDWTLIARADGRRQWAYKGQPIYLRYHDFPAAWGNIRAEGFQKLEPEQQALHLATAPVR